MKTAPVFARKPRRPAKSGVPIHVVGGDKAACQAIERVLRALPLDGVAEIRAELETDYLGEPAVRVFVIFHAPHGKAFRDHQAAMRWMAEDVAPICNDIEEALRAAVPTRWPHVHVRTVDEQTALDREPIDDTLGEEA